MLVVFQYHCCRGCPLMWFTAGSPSMFFIRKVFRSPLSIIENSDRVRGGAFLLSRLVYKIRQAFLVLEALERPLSLKFSFFLSLFSTNPSPSAGMRPLPPHNLPTASRYLFISGLIDPVTPGWHFQYRWEQFLSQSPFTLHLCLL